MTEDKYNPMSKEFQDECAKLGMTGRQLTAKYQKEGKSVEKGVYKIKRYRQSYTKEQLLWYLIQFYEKYGSPPTMKDLDHNFEYPSSYSYTKYFGSWGKALKLVGLDVESMVKKGVLETTQQIGRFGEMIIRDHYKTHPKDLAGENQNSPCDGICPNGMTYDVKSSGLDWTGRYYTFKTNNKYKEEIKIYYLLGFNEDYTKLKYGWRIPGKIAEKGQFRIGLNNSHKFNTENIKQYDITDKLIEILIKQGYFEKIKNYRKARENGLTIYEYDKQLYDGCIIAE
jgi:hypothetical protein